MKLQSSSQCWVPPEGSVERGTPMGFWQAKCWVSKQCSSLPTEPLHRLAHNMTAGFPQTVHVRARGEDNGIHSLFFFL